MGMENWRSSLSRKGLVRRARGEQGFSLVEVLIAAGILLIIALGLLPIFAQAIVHNRGGADYTQATNFAKSELERLYALPFSHPQLRVVGDATVRVQYFSQVHKVWIDGAFPDDEEEPTEEPTEPEEPTEEPTEPEEPEEEDDDAPLWTRTTTIRQYGLGGIVDVDKDGDLDDPLPGGTLETFVHVKEIEVRVESGRSGGPLGAGKRATLRVYKSF